MQAQLWRKRSAYLQMARITNPIMHVAVVCLLTFLLVDLWHLLESAVRLRIYAISSIYLDAVLAILYVRISSAELTSRSLLDQIGCLLCVTTYLQVLCHHSQLLSLLKTSCCC